MRRLPLEGVRVLDLTRVLAGPFCTMMLGDLGADVLKIERPPRGDDTREWGPPFAENGASAYYLSVNRNKLSIALDLADARDRDVVASLLSDAHIVVDNFLPGTLDRLGIDVSATLARHPELIWCTITGFGADSSRPGYDFVVQAEAGWMAITGEPDGAPMKVGVALADLMAGKDAAIAILAALAARRTVDVTRRIVISLADSARGALVNVAQNALVAGGDARRWGNAHANLVPYQLFQASDRAIVVAVGNDAQWIACARALGLAELAEDPGLATNRGRLARRAEVVEAFARTIASRPASQWIERLRTVDVPAGIVKSVAEAIRDATGASPVFGMPPATGGRVRLPPPALDEHGALLRNRGWEAFRVAAAASGHGA